jgi:hypothetical protein
VLALASRLAGGASRSGLWSSPDGRTWSETAVLPALGPAPPTAWALCPLADGSLLVLGTAVGPGGTPGAQAWTGSASSMRPRPVRGSADGLYAAVRVGSSLTAVGSAPSPAGTVAGTWTVRVG